MHFKLGARFSPAYISDAVSAEIPPSVRNTDLDWSVFPDSPVLRHASDTRCMWLASFCRPQASRPGGSLLSQGQYLNLPGIKRCQDAIRLTMVLTLKPYEFTARPTWSKALLEASSPSSHSHVTKHVGNTTEKSVQKGDSLRLKDEQPRAGFKQKSF